MEDEITGEQMNRLSPWYWIAFLFVVACFLIYMEQVVAWVFHGL